MEKDFHHFLLRNNQVELEDWWMCRLTFGVKSSPYVAMQVLHQAASDLADKYPLTSSCIDRILCGWLSHWCSYHPRSSRAVAAAQHSVKRHRNVAPQVEEQFRGVYKINSC